MAVLAGYAVLLLLNQGLNILQRRAAHAQLRDQVEKQLVQGLLTLPEGEVVRLPSGTELQRVPPAIQEHPRLLNQGTEIWMVSVKDGIQLRQNISAVISAQFRNDLLLVAVAGFSSLVTSTLLGPVLSEGMAKPLEQLSRTLTTASHTRFSPSGLVVEHQPEELRSIIVSYNRMQQRIVSAWELQRTFVDGVAHELRTPLTLISGYAQRLDRLLDHSPAILNEDIHTQLLNASTSIGAETERMARLVRDLLDLARFDADRLNLQLQTLDAGEALLAAYERLDIIAAGRLRLRGPMPDHQLVIRADPDRLNQCLTNLVENALRYSPSLSPVQLAAEQDDQQVILHVCDSGPGVQLDEREHIFQLFRRGSAALSASAGGSGIGLAMVRLLMEHMGGGVRVSDAPGGGADFQLWFPAIAAET